MEGEGGRKERRKGVSERVYEQREGGERREGKDEVSIIGIFGLPILN